MFRKLDDSISVAPQITPEQVAEAAKLGFVLVVNNRPDGESPDQTSGDEIEAAAKAAGLGYIAIPITHAGFSEPQIKAMAEVLDGAQGPVLAYCRSGTRSTMLWGLTRAMAGADFESTARKAAAAGYDLSPLRGAFS